MELREERLKQRLSFLVEDFECRAELHGLEHVLRHHVVSFDCEVEESVYLFRFFGSVLIDEIDNILAHLLGLNGVLDLVEALRRASLGLKEPIKKLRIRCILALINHLLDILSDFLCPLVCLEVLSRGEIDFGEPVPQNASLVYIVIALLIHCSNQLLEYFLSHSILGLNKVACHLEQHLVLIIRQVVLNWECEVHICGVIIYLM